MPECQTSSFSAFWSSYNSRKISQFGLNDFLPSYISETGLCSLWPLAGGCVIVSRLLFLKVTYATLAEETAAMDVRPLKPRRAFSPAPDLALSPALRRLILSRSPFSCSCFCTEMTFLRNPCLKIEWRVSLALCLHRM